MGNLAAMTMIGYVSMSAKDLIKGKDPKPLDDPRTWAASFIFSGAGGILGDFVFNDFQGYGKGVMDVVGGRPRSHTRGHPVDRTSQRR